ncbi:hypothetical protein MNBD_ALPHA12-424 [hydrothermal vent metagenome]|uniref:Uncharacterized protein n=1 Tax=hydrothermal vent metagenome TaxID=652676 RepID=A0A3B0TET4_9ZZZZ
MSKIIKVGTILTANITLPFVARVGVANVGPLGRGCGQG